MDSSVKACEWLELGRRKRWIPEKEARRKKRKLWGHEKLLCDDSGLLENCATFDLARVHRSAHHFQSYEHDKLVQAAVRMNRDLSPRSLREAQTRPTMKIRQWLRRNGHTTWREDSELQDILGGEKVVIVAEGKRKKKEKKEKWKKRKDRRAKS